MTFSENIKFLRLWQTPDELYEQKILDFWRNLNIQIPETPEKRVKEAIYAVLYQDKIIGLSTAYVQYFEFIGHQFYFYRSIIHPDFRQPGLAAKLLEDSVALLNELSNPENPDGVKGVIIVIDNKDLKKRNMAIWPIASFHFYRHRSI